MRLGSALKLSPTARHAAASGPSPGSRIPDPESRPIPAVADLTQLFRVLADDTRFRLLRLLDREELTVNELAEITQLAQPRISNHLKILREENLISERRSGSWRHYRLNLDEVSDQYASLQPVLEAAWRDGDRFAADDKRLAEVLAARQPETALAFFDQLAERWDEYRETLFGDAVGREILRAFLPEDLVVADVGTGTGYALHVFGNRAKKLIAIDRSEAMLDLARRKAQNAGLDRVEFRLANVSEEVPLADGEADVITLIQVLHHLEHPSAMIGRLAKALKPGGLLIINDLMEHQELWLCRELQHDWPGFARERIDDWLRAAGLRLSSWDVLPGKPLPNQEGQKLRVPDGFTAVARRQRPEFPSDF